MISFIKIVARLALQNPAIRNELKNVGIKSYKKAKPILKKNIKVFNNTRVEVSPLKDPSSFCKKLKENFKNYSD